MLLSVAYTKVLYIRTAHIAYKYVSFTLLDIPGVVINFSAFLAIFILSISNPSPVLAIFSIWPLLYPKSASPLYVKDDIAVWANCSSLNI